jgi:hypothetical protein
MDLRTVGASKVGAASVYLGAAVLEVVGDALIRKGTRGSGLALVCAGFAVLGSCGVVVNLLEADFSRLLRACVGVFAVVSVRIGPMPHIFRPKPKKWKPMMPMAWTKKLIPMVWANFLARVSPVSTSAKPACMNMTSDPARIVQTVLSAVCVSAMDLASSGIVGSARVLPDGRPRSRS